MKKVVVILFVMVLALSAACAPASRKPNTGSAQAASAQNVAASAGDAIKGKTLFTGSCSSCHGPDAKGLPNLGKDLTASAFVKGQDDTQLMAFIKKGRAASDAANTTGIDMPPKGGNPAITDKNLSDIIAFIRSVNK